VKYMLLICSEGPEPAEPVSAEEMDPQAWLDYAGTRRLDGDRLRDAQDATTVRVRSGATLTTDGPYVETKEQICGYDVIEVADLDEAIDIASKHPMARYGMVEVRPFWTQ
jgi:hypothetical protein